MIRAHSIVGTSPGRDPLDYYPTPAEATEALLRVEYFPNDILEPACGDGAISRVLEAHGHNVTSRDIKQRGFGVAPVDFLAEPDEKQTDAVITNPPYCKAEMFVEKALAVSRVKVAFLLKLSFLEGMKRKALFESSPLARVLVFSRRLSMHRDGVKMKNGGMIAFAWFIWEHGHSGAPKIGWLDTQENSKRIQQEMTI